MFPHTTFFGVGADRAYSKHTQPENDCLKLFGNCSVSLIIGQIVETARIPVMLSRRASKKACSRQPSPRTSLKAAFPRTFLRVAFPLTFLKAAFPPDLPQSSLSSTEFSKLGAPVVTALSSNGCAELCRCFVKVQLTCKFLLRCFGVPQRLPQGSLPTEPPSRRRASGPFSSQPFPWTFLKAAFPRGLPQRSLSSTVQ